MLLMTVSLMSFPVTFSQENVVHLRVEQCSEFYSEHIGKSFYPSVVSYLARSAVSPITIRYPNGSFEQGAVEHAAMGTCAKIIATYRGGGGLCTRPHCY